MGKTIIAEESLLNTLTELSEHDGYTSGLIIGQPSQKKDLAVNLLVTPADEESDSVNCIQKLEEIDENLLRKQLKNVMRSLPGGIYILGIFIVGPDDVFNDKNNIQKVRSLISTLNSTMKSNVYLFGSNQDISLVGLHFCSNSKKYLSKNFDVHNMSSSMTPVTWKFSKEPVSWCKIDCSYGMDYFSPLHILDKKKYSLSKLSKDILSNYVTELDNNKCAINGYTDKYSGSETLEDTIKKKGGTVGENGSPNILKAYMFGPLDSSEKGESVKEIIRVATLKYFGVLSSRVFLQASATVEEAVKAIKEDLIRTLAVRLELHCDSLENDNGSDMLHVPPRRVLYEHPTSGIAFSDYMFPDDTIEDVVMSFQENLGFEVSPSSLVTDFEPEGLEEENNDTTNSNNTVSSSNPGRDMPDMVKWSLLAAIVVLILSLCLQLFF